MKDGFGRNIDYLRISVTDRCPARCIYCMPASGVSMMPRSEILRFEEILRIASVAARAGIKNIKVTGGEPLARRGVLQFIAGLKNIEGISRISLTTNGIFLAASLDRLLASGLDAVNISLDTLDREKFRRIAGADLFDSAFAGLNAALCAVKAGRFLQVKINCVPIAGINEDDIVPLASLAEKNSADVRFIELMPLGRGRDFRPVAQSEITARLEAAFGPLVPAEKNLGAGPAVYYSARGFSGKIGFISPLSRIFCGSCNRIRLNAAGSLRPCLASENSIDIKAAVRNGADDEAVLEIIKRAIASKPRGHDFEGREADRGGLWNIGG